MPVAESASAATEELGLLQIHPELATGLSARRRAEAGRQLRVPVIALPGGDWTPPRKGLPSGVGYLVVGGTLLRRVVLNGGRSVELLAEGNLLLPWREDPVSFSRAEWQVIDSARLAVLDLRPGSPILHWPSIATTLMSRAIDRSRMAVLQSATMSIVGIEERLRILLWTFAERWGRLVPGGVEIDVNVPQAVLAEMVGARRPTVNLALGKLCNRGLLEPRGEGRWILLGEPPLPPGK
jgi:Crp-like helix-turn-helix protein